MRYVTKKPFRFNGMAFYCLNGLMLIQLFPPASFPAAFVETGVRPV